MRCLHLRKKDSTEADKRYTWQLTRTIDNKVRNYRINKAFITWPPTEVTAVSSAEISALGCAYFIDFDDQSKVLPGSIESGDDITSCTDQDNGAYVPSASAAGLEWTLVNSTHYLKSTVSWHAFSATCTISETNKCILGLLYIRSGAADHIILKTSAFGELWLWSNVLQLRQDDDTFVASTCTIPTDPIAITISKNSDTFDIWMKNLVSGVVQTDQITVDTDTSDSYAVGIATAQTGFIGHHVGSYFCITNNNAASLDLAQKYIEAKHTGIGQPAVIDPPHYLQLHSDWLTHLSRENDLIRNQSSTLISLVPYFKKTGDTNSIFRLTEPDPRKLADQGNLVGEVDFTFKDANDNLIVPSDFHVELSFQT